jgi:hypothetical protein
LEHGADWQALVVGVPDTVDGMFADSLIIICFCFLAVVKQCQEKSLQETCHPALRAENIGKALRSNMMQRKNAIVIRL